jgi:replicative DNA helicase
MIHAKAVTDATPIKMSVAATMNNIQRIRENPNSIPGLSTGFLGLDKLTLGLRGGTVFVIAARPAMGKTALAIKQNIPVGVFSLDLSAEELITRMLSSRSAVNLRALRNGLLTERDWEAIKTQVTG